MAQAVQLQMWSPPQNHKLQVQSIFLSMPPEDPVDLQGYSAKKLSDCAGNGMSIPCVGFALLVAIVALEPKKK